MTLSFYPITSLRFGTQGACSKHGGFEVVYEVNGCDHRDNELMEKCFIPQINHVGSSVVRDDDAVRARGAIQLHSRNGILAVSVTVSIEQCTESGSQADFPSENRS